jgi:hypothetical protein
MKGCREPQFMPQKVLQELLKNNHLVEVFEEAMFK